MLGIIIASVASAVAFVLALALPAAAIAAPVSAEPVDCGNSSLLIERAGVLAFELPRQAGEKFEFDPKEPLKLRFLNPPPSGHVDLTLKLPFGQEIKKTYGWTGLAPDQEFVVDVGPDDYGQYVDIVRGAYPLEATTYADETPVCTVPFEVGLGGIGISGPIGTAAAATSAAAAAGTVAAAGWMASSAARPPHVSLKVSIDRRRKRGWRKYVPVPSLKRTIIGSVMGTFTGIVISLALQQSGIEALTSFSLIRNAVVGAFGSVTTGVAWGSVWSFIRKPVDDDAKELPKAGAAGAPPVA